MRILRSIAEQSLRHMAYASAAWGVGGAQAIFMAECSPTFHFRCISTYAPLLRTPRVRRQVQRRRFLSSRTPTEPWGIRKPFDPRYQGLTRDRQEQEVEEAPN